MNKIKEQLIMKIEIKNNYEINENTDVTAVLNEINAELTEQLSGVQIQPVKLESPLVVERAYVSYNNHYSSVTEPEALVMVHFNEDSPVRGYAFEKALSRGIIKIAEVIDFSEIHEKLVPIINQLLNLEAERVKEAKRLAEEAKLAEEERLREIKYNEKVTKSITDLDNLETIAFDDNSFYTSLGWLAANAKTMSASVPDWAVSWFYKTFGDVKCSITDSKKIGPSGYTSQWLPSFTLTFKNPELLPTMFSQYKSKSADNKLANTKFLYTLATDYGFKFGKQDIDEIRKTIPTANLAEFELGVNM